MPNGIRTLENNRANFAYNIVMRVNQNRNEFKSWSKKVPVLIKTNGLGQTLAFLKARSNKLETDIMDIMLQEIEKWLVWKGEINAGEDIVKKITEIDSHVYQRWTREIIMLFNWIRRFAEGYLN